MDSKLKILWMKRDGISLLLGPRLIYPKAGRLRPYYSGPCIQIERGETNGYLPISKVYSQRRSMKAVEVSKYVYPVSHQQGRLDESEYKSTTGEMVDL